MIHCFTPCKMCPERWDDPSGLSLSSPCVKSQPPPPLHSWYTLLAFYSTHRPSSGLSARREARFRVGRDAALAGSDKNVSLWLRCTETYRSSLRRAKCNSPLLNVPKCRLLRLADKPSPMRGVDTPLFLVTSQACLDLKCPVRKSFRPLSSTEHANLFRPSTDHAGIHTNWIRQVRFLARKLQQFR